MKSNSKEIRINSPEKEKLEKMVQLILKMTLIGFDELEMTDRVKAVQLFGENITNGIDNFYQRLSILEDKVQSLEQRLWKIDLIVSWIN